MPKSTKTDPSPNTASSRGGKDLVERMIGTWIKANGGCVARGVAHGFLRSWFLPRRRGDGVRRSPGRILRRNGTWARWRSSGAPLPVSCESPLSRRRHHLEHQHQQRQGCHEWSTCRWGLSRMYPGVILPEFAHCCAAAKRESKAKPRPRFTGRNTPPQLPGDQRRKQQDDHAEWQQPAFQHVVVNRQPLPRQADQEPLEEVTPHGRSA